MLSLGASHEKNHVESQVDPVRRTCTHSESFAETMCVLVRCGGPAKLFEFPQTTIRQSLSLLYPGGPLQHLPGAFRHY